MPIIHCSDQKRQTLEEFYTDFTKEDSETWSKVGASMLSVLKLINDTFKETTIYGLTSHATLLFLSKDSYKTPWYVSISSLGDEFFIEYLMTKDKQPWSSARVKGGTKSYDELKKMIIIAMTESEGWQESGELKTLMTDQARHDS